MSRRGFSLLEVLLAASLLLVLLSCLLAVVMPMMRAAERASRMSDLRQMAALSLAQIAREVELSAAPGIRLYQGGSVLAVQRLQGLSADASSIWQREMTLFAAGGGRLRKISGVTAPLQSRAHGLEPAELTAALRRRGSVLCTEVVEFGISGRSDHGLRPPLRIRLALRRDGSTFALEQSAVPAVRTVH